MKTTTLTKNEIISEIANDKIVENIYKNMRSSVDKFIEDDFIQFIYLTLLEMNEEFLIRLYEDNELNKYINTIIRFNIFSKTSPFYYKVKRYFIDSTDDIIAYTPDTSCEIDEVVINKYINQLTNTEKIIFDMLDEFGSQVIVAEKLNISQCWISRCVKAAKLRIKNNIEDDKYNN